MRAIVIREPGGPDVLELRDVPEPHLAEGHVRVAVQCVGVNRADLLQRAGFYPAPPGVPADIPGLEYAGRVEALGAGVSRWREGDRVFGLVAGGAYAEKLVVHERECAPIPEGLDDVDAASLPEAFVTAYDALFVRGRLTPGERVLVSAAGSGVGTAAIQLARSVGCFVVGTSRTADKLERCRALGLDAAVVPTGTSFADAVRAAAGGAGVDVVVELVGGSYVAEDVRAVAARGRVVVVGLSAGIHAELDLAALLRQRVEIIGTVLRSRPLEEKIDAARVLERNLVPLFARGALRAVVDRVFDLAEAGAAHAYVASNESFGKVLLRVSGG
jgi:putative PIG3 family NAD(P)H quinone oxidoreductase